MNNSKINQHIVLSILPTRYQSDLTQDLETYTLLSFRFYKLFYLFKKLRKLSLSDNLVIKTWGHAAAFISKFSRLFLTAPIIWGIHDSGPGNQKLVSLLVKLTRKISYYLPDSIICVSQATCDQYKKLGYDHKKFIYIANGLDSNRFHPNSQSYETRKLLGVPDSTAVIGLIYRYCIEKGVNIFIETMPEIFKELPNVKFVFCGSRMDSQNRKLIKKLRKHEIL